jgi:hypothetical protein
MVIVEARTTTTRVSLQQKRYVFSFAYFGLAICMLVTIYIAALSPGNTPGALALMSVFP